MSYRLPTEEQLSETLAAYPSRLPSIMLEGLTKLGFIGSTDVQHQRLPEHPLQQRAEKHDTDRQYRTELPPMQPLAALLVLIWGQPAVIPHESRARVRSNEWPHERLNDCDDLTEGRSARCSSTVPLRRNALMTLLGRWRWCRAIWATSVMC